MSSFTLNTKEAIGDFRRYDKITQERFKRTLLTAGGALADKQWKHLNAKVKNWTGTLGSSIKAGRVKNMSIEVGPGKNIAYAWFIEAGASASQRARGNTFAGYHYVKDTLKSIENQLIKALKKDIERPTA